MQEKEYPISFTHAAMLPRRQGNNYTDGRLMPLWLVVVVVLWGCHFVVLVDAALAATRTTTRLATTTSSKRQGIITVRPILAASHYNYNKDVQALADLRFDEWIAGVYNDTSRTAFQVATADFLAERQAGGAVAFLARQDQVVLGAGELSPIEVQGALRGTKLVESGNDKNNNNEPAPITALYVTDVVTAKQHRRKGVAQAIMQAMEDYALQNQGETACLLLHVHPTNAQALDFYAKTGYSEMVPPALCLDTDRLAENAGTVGQVLLCKSLSKPQKTSKRPRRRGGGGFG